MSTAIHEGGTRTHASDGNTGVMSDDTWYYAKVTRDSSNNITYEVFESDSDRTADTNVYLCVGYGYTSSSACWLNSWVSNAETMNWGVTAEVISFAGSGGGGNMDFDNVQVCTGECAETAGIDAQIDDIVIFDEAIGYFAVETLYDSGNHRPPSSLQAPSYASHWDLNGDGDNLQPPTNPNTETSEILKNQAGTVGAPQVPINRDGTNNGAITGVTGKVGDAWDFDGSDYVEVNANLEPNSNDADTKWSMNVWFNSDNTGSHSPYLSAGSSHPDRIDFRYYHTGDNQYIEHDYDLNIADSFNTAGQWYMLTNVRDGDDWYQYRDGVLIGSVTGEDFTITDKNTWNIGNSIRGDGGHDGQLDEMTMWSEALTLADVQALCNDSGGCQGIAYTDANFPEKSSVVAHYDFEQTGTTLENQALAVLPYSDFDGTRNGDTTAGVSGIDGFSYRFDGNDHVSLSNVIKGTGDFTVSTWIMPENLQTWEHWLSSYDSGSGTNWAFGLNNGQVFWYSESIATDYSTETLTEDAWNHVVVKRVDGNITFVIDGVPDNSVHDRTNVDYADSVMAIGGTVGASSQNFYGLVDETSFWDRALSDEEITILYNNKSLKNLPTVTTGTATTTVGIEDSSGLHEVGGQLQTSTS